MVFQHKPLLGSYALLVHVWMFVLLDVAPQQLHETEALKALHSLLRHHTCLIWQQLMDDFMQRAITSCVTSDCRQMMMKRMAVHQE